MFEKAIAALNFTDKMIREAGGVAASMERMLRQEAKDVQLIAPYVESAARQIIFGGLGLVVDILAEVFEPMD